MMTSGLPTTWAVLGGRNRDPGPTLPKERSAEDNASEGKANRMTTRRLLLLIALPCLVLVSRKSVPCQDSKSAPVWKVKKLAVEERMYRGKGGGPVIFVVSPPGSEPRRLALGWSPAISPDGEAVVYLTWWRYRWGQLRIINADGSGNRRFTHLDVPASDPDWSPDGKGLAITARENHKPMIAILDMLGKNLTPLTEENPHAGLRTGSTWRFVGL